MRSYVLIGLVLTILGFGGSVFSCSQSGLFDRDTSLTESAGDAESGARTATTGATAIVSGLLLALGLGLIGFGAGTTWHTKRLPDKADDPDSTRLPL